MTVEEFVMLRPESGVFQVEVNGDTFAFNVRESEGVVEVYAGCMFEITCQEDFDAYVKVLNRLFDDHIQLGAPGIFLVKKYDQALYSQKLPRLMNRLQYIHKCAVFLENGKLSLARCIEYFLERRDFYSDEEVDVEEDW